MKNIYNNAGGLISGSGKEAGIYLAACLAAAGLYMLTCRALGLVTWNDPYAALKASPVKGFLAFLPGMIVTAWFSAGLAGRFTMGALSGAPKEMGFYSKGWFLRKLAAETLLALLMWVPVLLLLFMPFAGALFCFIWFIAAAWFGLRISLWLNASVAENLSFVDAAHRSFEISKGQVPRFLILGAVPMLAAGLLKWLLGKALPGQAVLLYYSVSVVEGAGAIFVMGIFAALYLELQAAPAAAPVPAEQTAP